MDNEIKDFINDAANIEIESEYHFKTLYGFTFVFQKETVKIRGDINAISITPKGIIYEENDEYYFAPLHETVEIEEIIKEFVGKKII